LTCDFTRRGLGSLFVVDKVAIGQVSLPVLCDQDEPANPQTKLNAGLHGVSMQTCQQVNFITFRGPRLFLRQYIDQSHLSNRLPVRLVSKLGLPMHSWRLCSIFTDYMTHTPGACQVCRTVSHRRRMGCRIGKAFGNSPTHWPQSFAVNISG